MIPRSAVLLLVLVGCTSDNNQTKILQPPEVSISSPATGDLLKEETSATAIGAVVDPDNSADELILTWSLGSDTICDGHPEDDGSTTCAFAVPGGDSATLALHVEDPDGHAADAEISFLIDPQDAPAIDISAPTADGRYYADHALSLSALTADTEDAPEDLLVTWTSSLDGPIAELSPASDGEALTTVTLSAGEHTLTATVTDTTGRTAADNVVVEIGPPNSAPTCAISSPLDGDVLLTGQPALIEGTIGDADEPADGLALTWTSSLDGVLSTEPADSAGATGFSTSALSPGIHVLTLATTDELGLTCADSVTFTVGSPPTVTIDLPLDGTTATYGDPLSFSATVADPDEPAQDLILSWTDTVDGVRSTASADSGGQALFVDAGLSSGDHVVTLRATDSTGLYAEAVVTLSIDCPLNFHEDADADGFGAGAAAPDAADCSAPEGWVTDTTDCDDTTATVNPAATEVCDGLDDNCDGVIDTDAIDRGTWYVDADGDGVGAEAVIDCTAPAGTVERDGDCDDSDASISPDATETCNAVDDNCDGAVDEGFVDTDADSTPDCRDDCPVWVGPDGVAGDGSEASPYASINDAIALRGEACDDIVVLPGTYEETVVIGSSAVDYSGADTRNVTITSEYAYRYGDYRDLLDSDADGWPDDVDCASDPEDGYQVVITPDSRLSLGPGMVINGGQDESTIITGLTFWGGTGTDQWADAGDTRGGGLYIDASSPIVTQSVFRCNSTTKLGGGLFATDSDVQILDDVFQSNTVKLDSNSAGGGAALYYGTPIFQGNVVLDNLSTADDPAGNPDGGGIILGSTAALVVDNWFEGNVCDDAGLGGAIRSGSSDAVIAHNVIVNNWPDGIGLSYSDAGVVANNTIVDNGNYGIQTYTAGGSGSVSTVVANNIIMGHGVGVYLRTDNKLAAIAYNDLYDNDDDWKASFDSTWDLTGDDGNFSSDPLLISRTYGDYHLNMLSPCDSAGSTWAWLDAYIAPYGWSITTDFDGDALDTTGGDLDVGAYVR